MSEQCQGASIGYQCPCYELVSNKVVLYVIDVWLGTAAGKPFVAKSWFPWSRTLYLNMPCYELTKMNNIRLSNNILYSAEIYLDVYQAG